MPNTPPELVAETLFQAFENADIAVVVTIDRGHRVERLYVNDAAARISGYTRAELLQMGGTELLVPADRAELERIRAKVRAGEPGPRSYETTLITRDGRHVPVHVGLANAMHAGEPCAVAFLQDLTAAHAIRDALAASERRFRELAERAPDMIAVIADGRVVYTNPTGLRVLGYASVAEIAAVPIADLVAPEHLPRLTERLARVQRGERLPPVEYHARRKDGSIVVMEASTVNTQFEGRPASVTFARDVSERHALLNRALQQDRLASAGTLAAGAAHEINNPLTSVLLNLELLRLQAENAGTRGALSIPLLDEAIGGAQRVARIVQDLLSLARPTDEVWDLVHVEDVARSAVRLAMTTGAVGIRVETILDGLPPVRTNGARLGQVLLNVVVNALQALRGRPDARVTLTGRVRGHTLVLVLQDNGPGIPAAVLPRVYDPFFTTKEAGEGTGLGLTVSHAIMTSLGGAMRIESEEGRGTTVSLELPVEADVDAEDAAPPPGAQNPSRVLLIDDEQPVTRVLGALLADTHETAACNDPAEALALLAVDGRWDAIICDIRMPGLSGAALYNRVREAQPALAARFVFTTGGALESEDADILAASGRPVLGKPFTRKRLLAAIETVLAAGRSAGD